MATTFFKVKIHSAGIFIAAATMAVLFLDSCKKNDPPYNNEVSSYTSDVLDKWITMQLRLMKNATGIPNQAFSRHFVYTGIAALESVSPGLSVYTYQYRRWNGLTGLPIPDHSAHYYYAANINGAMAAINRSLFPNAAATDKAAIDSLESALNTEFTGIQPQANISKSSEFGKAVASAVFNWAETDGYKNANSPYTPPTGPGLWKPTPPALAAASTPYWGSNRPVIAGSIDNTQPPAPLNYSADPTSPFYQMVKQVYDVSQHLSTDQMAMAAFWRDVPGVTSPGHWLSILQQVIRKKSTRLDKAVIAYAMTGAAINDALISCWKAKYNYNLIRPITYIREVMGYSSWNSYIGTPPHPEYSSAHSSLSGAAAAALEKLFGHIGSFTDHTYDYSGLAPRTYNSFNAIAEEAALSRLYAGIHYQPSLQAALIQGRKVADNIFDRQRHHERDK